MTDLGDVKPYLSVLIMLVQDYQILSLAHQKVSVNELGKYQIQTDNYEDEKAELLALKEAFGIEEMIYVSTCNRITFIFYNAVAVNQRHLIPFFRKVNKNLSEADLEKLPEIAEFHNGIDAINHLYRVASSLESLVVGEKEILRQTRTAFEKCLDWKLCGDHLRILMRSTVEISKDVFSNTRIGEKPVSVVSLAIQSFLNEGLQLDAKILMIGAGETNTLVAKYLYKKGYTNVEVFNRNIENGKVIKSILNTEIHPLSALENYTKGFDAIVICTASHETILTRDLYQQLIQTNAFKKIIIDLSVPSNTDPAIKEQFPVHYIDIESLRHQAKANIAFRKSEMTAAESIISKEVQLFPKKIQRRAIERALNFVPAEIRAIKERALTQVYKNQLDQLDENTKSLVLEMMDYMEKKCVSIPIKTIKEELASTKK